MQEAWAGSPGQYHDMGGELPAVHPLRRDRDRRYRRDDEPPAA